MFQKKYSIEKELGSKVVLRIVKFLLKNITNFYGLTEIASKLNTSKSNVHRALKKLENLDLLRVRKYHGKKLYQINPHSNLSFPLWNLLVGERYLNIEKNLKDTLESLLRDIKKEKIKAMIILPDGEESNGVNLCLVCDDKRERQRLEYSAGRFSSRYKLKLHFLSKREFENLNKSLGLDALLNGIPLYGKEYIFKVRVKLREFPKSYLSFKIKKARNMLEKVKKRTIKPFDEKYFKELAVIYLKQIEEAISPEKRTTQGELENLPEIEKWINELEEKIESID